MDADGGTCNVEIRLSRSFEYRVRIAAVVPVAGRFQTLRATCNSLRDISSGSRNNSLLDAMVSVTSRVPCDHTAITIVNLCNEVLDTSTGKRRVDVGMGVGQNHENFHWFYRYLLRFTWSTC